MKKDKLVKFFLACRNLAPDGQVTITSNKAVSSHTDSSGVVMFYVECNDFTSPDGVFGIDFLKVETFISSMKEDSGSFDIIEKEQKIITKFGKTSRSLPLLTLATLRPIRPRISQKMSFTCKIEVDKNEFMDIISVIDKGLGGQPNALAKVEVGYNGKELYIKTSDDPVDFVERHFEVTSVETGKGDVFKSFYPFYFIKEFAKVFKKIDSDVLCISFGNDMPMMCTMGDDDVLVEYLLAQIVEQG